MSEKKDSFQQLEHTLTVFVLLDLALFIFYLVSAGANWTVLKYLSAALSILVAGFGFWVLINTKQLKNHHCRWIPYSFGAIVLCTVVSLICQFP